MTLTPKPKTSFVILEILKILIQNQVKVGEYYIETCRGKDARHRVSTNPDWNLFTGNIPQKHPSPSKYVGYVPTRCALTQILCAQQLMVWIRIFRMYRINDNVVGLSGKVNVRWCFHFEAYRRCVTHRRKKKV